MTHDEPPHQDLCCLQIQLFLSLVLRELRLGASSGIQVFRPDFTSKLVHGLAFGTPKFYIAPFDKITIGELHYLVTVSSIIQVKT